MNTNEYRISAIKQLRVAVEILNIAVNSDNFSLEEVRKRVKNVEEWENTIQGIENMLNTAKEK